MAVTIAGAAVAAGIGLYKIFQGAKAKKEAKRNAARLQQPNYQVQNEYFQNRNIAEANATQGYTGAARDYLTNQNNQGLGSGITAITSSGGSSNDIAKLYSAYLRSTNQTAAQDSQMQLGNIERYREANTAVAGQRNIGWSLNERQPYETKRKEFRQDAAIADANINEGMNTVGGAISAYGTSRLNANMIPKNKTQQPQLAQRDYFATQPVQTESAYGGINPTMQARTVPNTYNPNGGGNDPYAVMSEDQNNWGEALGLNYN